MVYLGYNDIPEGFDDIRLNSENSVVATFDGDIRSGIAVRIPCSVKLRGHPRDQVPGRWEGHLKSSLPNILLCSL